MRPVLQRAAREGQPPALSQQTELAEPWRITGPQMPWSLVDILKDLRTQGTPLFMDSHWLPYKQ